MKLISYGKLFVCALALILLALWWGFLHFNIPPDPHHAGKPLSEWLAAGRSSNQREEARAAIQALGSAAVPLLEHQLQSHPSHLPNFIRALASHLGLGQVIKPPQPDHRVTDALFGIAALREQASPLVQRLLKSPNRSTRHSALLGVDKLGSKSLDLVPEILNVLQTDPSPQNRALAAETLGNLDSNPLFIRHLMTALEDPNSSVRLYAALALARFDKGELLVKNQPAFMNLVWNQQFDGKTAASKGSLNPAATNALPALTQLLRDPNRHVQAAAQFALDEIRKLK